MALKIDRYDTRCAMCHNIEATKTGSHIVPNFMIHSMFSQDRLRELVWDFKELHISD